MLPDNKQKSLYVAQWAVRVTPIQQEPQNLTGGALNINHVGAQHCRKPLGQSVGQSINKQEPSFLY